VARALSPDAAVSTPEHAGERDADALSARALQAAPARVAAPPELRQAGPSRAGAALSPEVRSYFEPRFGWDFGSVRVHAGGEAATAASAVQARAYTHGSDIVFGAGEYAPATPRGRQLLSHELAHVFQHESSAAARGTNPASAATAPADGGRLMRQPVDKPAPAKEPAKPPAKDPQDIRGQKRPKPKPGAPKKLRLLVVLWDPGRKDQGPRPTAKEIEDSLFGPQAESLREFYLNQSGGKAVIEKVAVIDWLKADKPADHYWKHPEKAADGFKDGHVEKWAEALGKADTRVDFSSFDDNGDLELTAEELGILIVIPQAAPDGFNRMAEGPNQKRLVLDGVNIGMIAEVYMPSPMNLGVTRHELGHLLFGLPDLYENKKHPKNQADAFSLMSITYTDAQIDAPSRLRLGWVTGKAITGSGSYKIKSVETSREVLTYDRPGSKPREYIVIERREKGKYDKDLPVYGLVMWRVVDDGDPENLYRYRPYSRDTWPMNAKLDGYTFFWSGGITADIVISVDPTRPDEVQISITAPKAPQPAMKQAPAPGTP
jgi:M6 family metalloprotease-like protein